MGLARPPRMTAAELRAWIARQGWSHDEAADRLALSRDGLRKQLYGQRPVGAQTARIVQLIGDGSAPAETSVK